MASHSSILAGKNPWMEEPGGLQPLVTKSQTLLSHETHTQSNYTPIKIYLKNNIHDDIAYTLEEEMATHSSILAWQILWTKDTGGLQSIESQSWARLSD